MDLYTGEDKDAFGKKMNEILKNDNCYDYMLDYMAQQIYGKKSYRNSKELESSKESAKYILELLPFAFATYATLKK